MKQKSALTKPRITGISHMALFAKDPEESLIFYRDFLGFEAQGDREKSIKVNDRQFIALIPEPDGNTGRLAGTALLVEDAEAMRAYLDDRGWDTPRALEEDSRGNWAFSVKDPDGHTLTFVQYLPGASPLKDTGKNLGPDRVSVRIKHIGFTVKDLEASLTFYRDILGCVITWQGSADDRKLSWVNMRLPDCDEYLELMLIDEEPDDRLRGILDHMSLDVDEIHGPVGILRDRARSGCYTQEIEPQQGLNNKWQLNLYDPDGTRAELMETDEFNHRSPDWFLPG